ncbi:ATP-grasp domain-containing protein [Macrococcoides bohemicum]|uniref:ATP-grasp domain-containing protein n=1 Tax=Macrococcoides bohemicum TaxID=1903056 RepID=UPI001059CC64|nr:ATP-grasp domain-containing protein [Macrococcus bohemicus]TDL33470.1 ATP-grasp domain-containing protein [Macrococcus bohemicus]
MNIVFITRDKYDRTPLSHVNLSEMNFYIFCLKKHELTFEIFNNVKSYDKFDDELDKDIILLNSNSKIDRIFVFDERDIERAANLRSVLNIKGLKIEEAKIFRNKNLMKIKIESCGFKTPEYKMINTFEELESFIRNKDYPLILKPVDGLSSIGVKKISSFEEYNEIKEEVSLPCLIEEYIDGDMFHIDGIVDNGEVIFKSVTKYITQPLEYTNGLGLNSMLLPNSDPMFLLLSEYTDRITNILNFDEQSIFHLEVFFVKEEILFCEIACRAGGGNITKMIEIAYGVNIEKEYIELSLGRNITSNILNNNSQYYLKTNYLNKEGVLSKPIKDPMFSWCVHFEFTGKVNKYYTAPQNYFDYYAQSIIKSEKKKDLNNKYFILLKYIEKQKIWR